MFRYLILSFAALSAAAPLSASDYVQDLSARALHERASINAQELSDLAFYAEYAGASYCNTGTAAGAKVTCSGGVCPTVEGNAVTVSASFQGLLTGIGGFVAVDHARKDIILSIRGSNNVRNFITDIVFATVPCTNLVSGCLVHAGFNQAWKEIEKAATAAISAAAVANPDYRVIATGHSLGAAVSTLAAAYLRKLSLPVEIYSYGSPRVGNAAFAQFVSDQAGSEFRVTHVDDPVPRLPPIVFGFRHTSPEYWLSNGDGNKLDYTPEEVQVCEGIANIRCNAKPTLTLNTDAHVNYLIPIAACGPPISLRQADISNELLAERLHAWALADVAVVESSS
jgi:hypothetical protein